MLRSAFGSKCSLIVVFLTTVKAVGMHSSQVKNEQMKMLGFVKEVVGILLNLVETLNRNLLFWVNNFSNQTFAEINVPFNSVISKLRGNHDILSDSSVMNWV